MPKKKQSHQLHQPGFDFAVEPGAKRPVARPPIKRAPPRNSQLRRNAAEATRGNAAPPGLSVLHRDAKSILSDLKTRTGPSGGTVCVGEVMRLLVELEMAVDELATAHGAAGDHAPDLERRVHQKDRAFDAF